MAQYNDSPEYSLSAISVPFAPFRESNPKAWFSQIEATFALRNITTELTKFHHVVSALPPHIVDEVDDILSSPGDQPYLSIKEAVIQRIGLSDKQRLTKLLEDTELGDRKPSQLLRHMRHLAGNAKTEDTFFRELWLKRLPVDMQAVLCTSLDAPLEQIAAVADNIWETFGKRVNQIIPEQPSGLVSKLVTQVELLTQRVEALSVQRGREQRSFRPRRRSRPRSNSRRRVRLPTPPGDTTGRICWYHQKYGNGAKYCDPPCAFPKPQQGNGKASA